MFITKGHFLSPYTRVVKNDEVLSFIHSIDTDLSVCIRIVGFDEADQTPLLDLIKVDLVYFVTEGMPSQLLDLIPEDLIRYKTDEDFQNEQSANRRSD